MTLLKLLIKEIIHLLLHLFHLFPMKKNRIVFESWGGTRIGCNPFYLYTFLKNKTEGKNLELAWIIRSDIVPDKGTVYVRRNTFRYFRYVLTAKVYVTNTGSYDYLPFRNRQVVLNTWHACCAYKKIELDFYRFKGLKAWLYNRSIRHVARSTTYFLSAAQAATKGMCSAWRLSERQAIASGLPRNDVFFHFNRMEECASHVRKQLGIEKEYFIVLYAPTYRNTTDNPMYKQDLNEKKLIETVKKYFSVQHVILLSRMHINIINRHPDLLQKSKGCENIKDVSSYPEMQDLLCAADMLITDYSSSVWDYSFTYRPCFLFTPDLEAYKAKTDFYTPIEEWGFPICRSNEELWNAIETFDEQKFRLAMNHHHAALGSYEKGTATEEVGKLILSLVWR